MAIAKYKDPVTGNYIPVKTKTIDTLPVGTEVDFDGNEVPSGWTETNKTYKSETYSLSGKTVTAGGSLELGTVPTISGKTFIGSYIKNGASIAGLIGTIIDKNSSKVYLLCSNAQTFGSAAEVTITYMYADSKKIKKTSQYIEGGASLSNVYGTSNENGYTQEYINGLETYSTTEQRIGTWIDGKPIYRKVIELGSLPNNTYKDVSTGLTHSNIRLTKLYGVCYTSTGDSQTFIGDMYTRFELRANNTIRITTAANYSNYTSYAIIEYTKTTDTAQNTRSISNEEEPIEEENR